MNVQNHLYLYSCVCVSVCVCIKSFSCVRFLVTLWTVAPSGSSVRGTLQTRILEWVAIPYSRESSIPRVQTLVSYIAGGFFYHMNHQGSPSLLILRLSFQSLKSLLSEKTNSSAQALDSTGFLLLCQRHHSE